MTYVGFRAHVKIASRIVSCRINDGANAPWKNRGGRFLQEPPTRSAGSLFTAYKLNWTELEFSTATRNHRFRVHTGDEGRRTVWILVEFATSGMSELIHVFRTSKICDLVRCVCSQSARSMSLWVMWHWTVHVTYFFNARCNWVDYNVNQKTRY